MSEAPPIPDLTIKFREDMRNWVDSAPTDYERRRRSLRPAFEYTIRELTPDEQRLGRDMVSRYPTEEQRRLEERLINTATARLEIVERVRYEFTHHRSAYNLTIMPPY